MRTMKNPGVSVADLWERRGRHEGKRWWFRVKVRGRTATRAFANEDRSVGVAWSLKMRADLERDDFAPRAVPLLEVLKSHVGDRDGAEQSDVHLAEVSRIVKAVAEAGVNDLRRSDCLAVAKRVIDGMTDCASVTRARYAGHVRAVGETARKLHRLARNPFDDLSVVVGESDAPAVFTLEEARLLASDASVAMPYGLMMAVALYSGLRLREAAWLRWDDVRDQHAEGFIAIDPPTTAEREDGARLKRNKRRTVILMDELRGILAKRRPAAGAQGDGYVMERRIRKAASKLHMRLIREHLTALGIERGERTYHSLRHTHAGLALACGVDGMALELSMGHAEKETTKHYAQQANRLRGSVREWERGQIQLRRAVAPALRVVK